MTSLKVRIPKALHHSEYYLTKKHESQIDDDSPEAENTPLLKYFPKYYKKLRINVSSEVWPVLLKLKGTKVIENLTISNDEDFFGEDKDQTLHKFEQKIFRNKRKSVKSLPAIDGLCGDALRLQITNFFPRITSLDLSSISEFFIFEDDDDISSTFVSREKKREIRRYYCNFWGSLRYLKHLKMCNNNKYFCVVIQELNSSPHFLSSLKTLKFSLAYSENLLMSSHVRDMLTEFAKNENFLSHLTHLDCNEFEIMQRHDEVMASVLSQSLKLVSLTIPTGKEVLYGSNKSNKCLKVLNQLKSLNQLQTLSISTYDIITFVKHYCTPPSVRKFVLDIEPSLSNPEFHNFFQKPEEIYFEHCKEFQNLQSFKLKMDMMWYEPVSNHALCEFAKLLLKDMSSLKKFSFMLKRPSFPPLPLDFSLFLENSPVINQLESLKIETNACPMTFDSEKGQLLSHLKKITINGEISEEFNSKSFLQLFLSPPADSNVQIKKSLKIPTLPFRSFTDLKESLKLISKKTRSGNLMLELHIKIIINSFQELFDHLKDPINLSNDATVDFFIQLKSQSDSGEESGLSENHKNELKRIFGSFSLCVYEEVRDSLELRRLL